MCDPYKQVSHRRLPPYPGNTIKYRITVNEKEFPVTGTDFQSVAGGGGGMLPFLFQVKFELPIKIFCFPKNLKKRLRKGLTYQFNAKKFLKSFFFSEFEL